MDDVQSPLQCKLDDSMENPVSVFHLIVSQPQLFESCNWRCSVNVLCYDLETPNLPKGEFSRTANAAPGLGATFPPTYSPSSLKLRSFCVPLASSTAPGEQLQTVTLQTTIKELRGRVPLGFHFALEVPGTNVIHPECAQAAHFLSQIVFALSLAGENEIPKPSEVWDAVWDFQGSCFLVCVRGWKWSRSSQGCIPCTAPAALSSQGMPFPFLEG